MKTILEKKTKSINNESTILKGIYLNDKGIYEWITSTRSGECKKLSTAIKKVS